MFFKLLNWAAKKLFYIIFFNKTKKYKFIMFLLSKQYLIIYLHLKGFKFLNIFAKNRIE